MASRRRNWWSRITRAFGTSASPEAAPHPEPSPSFRAGEAPADDGDFDPTAPHPIHDNLTWEQGELFEDYLWHEFDLWGFDVEIMPGRVIATGADGKMTSYRLGSLTDMFGVVDDVDRAMPGLVQRFVSDLLNAPDYLALRDADFYRGLRVRLQAVSDLATEKWVRDAVEAEGHSIPQRPTADDVSVLFTDSSPVRPFAEDTVVRLCFDSEKAVQLINADGLTDRGPVEDLFRIGYRNLWQELVDSTLSITELDHMASIAILPEGLPATDEEKRRAQEAASCWVISTDSYYGGSLPIVLDDILEAKFPNLDRSEGVLFSTPHRHTTIVRAVTPGLELFSSISLMIGVTTNQFLSNPGAISPNVSLSHAGEIEVISRIVSSATDEEPDIEVIPTPHLIRMMEEGRG